MRLINRCAEEPAPPIVSPSLQVVAFDLMMSYEGEYERNGYNRSKLIDSWNRLAGAPLGSSYCMAAVVSMFDSAARSLGETSPLLKTPSCARQLQYAAMIGSGLEVIPMKMIGAREQIERGDIMIHRNGGGSEREIGRLFAGHTGIADLMVGTVVKTIEANTSPSKTGSQRNGDGVYYRQRDRSWWLALIRIP